MPRIAGPAMVLMAWATTPHWVIEVMPWPTMPVSVSTSA